MRIPGPGYLLSMAAMMQTDGGGPAAAAGPQQDGPSQGGPDTRLAPPGAVRYRYLPTYFDVADP